MDDQTKQSFSWIQRLLRNKSSYLHVDDTQEAIDHLAATITRLEGEVAEEHKLMRYFMSGSHRYAHQRDRFRAVARDLHARLAGYNHEMELAHAEDLAWSEEKLNVERAQREQAERDLAELRKYKDPVGVDTIIKLQKLMTRLGISTEGSIEAFGLEFEYNLLIAMRAVEKIFLRIEQANRRAERRKHQCARSALLAHLMREEIRRLKRCADGQAHHVQKQIERAELAERERDRLLDRVANAIFCPPTMRQCQKGCAEGSADARDCWLAWARGDE